MGMDTVRAQARKPLVWVGSSWKDLKALPDEVQDEFGVALRVAQGGGRHSAAKPLRGFNGGKTLEVVENFRRNTYRAVYTVAFEGRVYVLHCFQKKAKAGIATPKPEINLIRARLKEAARQHNEWQKST